MKLKSKIKASEKMKDSFGEAKQPVMRMLARCKECVKEYVPRGRGDVEVATLKLYYIPHENLDSGKRALICPMHKDEPAGLILSEDCLTSKVGTAMGMLAFKFTDREVELALTNKIWPKSDKRIEIDASMASSLSDSELLQFVRAKLHEKKKG